MLRYGIFGMLVTVYGFFMGSMIDNLGVKWSLVGGMTILFVSRLALTLTTDARAADFLPSYTDAMDLYRSMFTMERKFVLEFGIWTV